MSLPPQRSDAHAKVDVEGALQESDSAEVGLRDVTVTAGATASVYKGAFDVESPVDLQVAGLNAQGSVFLERLADKDPSTPFDTTSQTSQFGSTTYLGIELPQVAGFKFQVQNVTATTVDFVAFVDVKAETTPQPFTFLSGVQGSAQTLFPFPKGLAITARTPEVLTLGTAKDAAIAEPLETSLYEVTPAAALGFTDLAVTTTDKTLNPRAFVLGKSGAFAEQVAPLGASTLLITSSADPLYAIVTDLAGNVVPLWTHRADCLRPPKTNVFHGRDRVLGSRHAWTLLSKAFDEEAVLARGERPPHSEARHPLATSPRLPCGSGGCLRDVVPMSPSPAPVLANRSRTRQVQESEPHGAARMACVTPCTPSLPRDRDHQARVRRARRPSPLRLHSAHPELPGAQQGRTRELA